MPSPKLGISVWGGRLGCMGREVWGGDILKSQKIKEKCNRGNRLTWYSPRGHSQVEDTRRPSQALGQGDHSIITYICKATGMRL